MPDYQNGKIYKILSHIDNEVYVGSTYECLSTRLARHRARSKRETNTKNKLLEHFNKLGVENFYLELIEDYPCERKGQLLKREGECIR